MTPFGQVPCFHVETYGGGYNGRHLLLPTVKGASGGQSYIGLHWVGTTGDWTPSETELVRLYCHALLQRLPDEALRDAMEYLTTDYEFYQAQLNPPMRFPERVTRTFPARVVERRVATLPPVIEID